jgi:hypothetical protein
LVQVLAVGFLAAALGMGLLVSNLTETQVQAMLGVFALTLPSILLSGFFFERSLVPPVMQWLGYAIPLTYFLELLRGIVLRGASLEELWQPVAAMLALATLMLVVASVRFAPGRRPDRRAGLSKTTGSVATPRRDATRPTCAIFRTEYYFSETKVAAPTTPN